MVLQTVGLRRDYPLSLAVIEFPSGFFFFLSRAVNGLEEKIEDLLTG